MWQVEGPENYPGRDEFNVIKNHVNSAFAVISQEKDSNPSGWKPFEGSGAIDLLCHAAFVEEVVVSALPKNMELDADQIEAWHIYGNVTPDQLIAYGEIAAGVCLELGYEAAGKSMAEHVEGIVTMNWASVR